MARDERLIRRSAPITLIGPVVFASAMALFGPGLRGTAIVVGVAGWIASMVVRRLEGSLASRLLPSRFHDAIWLAASGFAEEPVRAVLVRGLHFDWVDAFSLGVGWAAVEISYQTLLLVQPRSLRFVFARERSLLEGRVRGERADAVIARFSPVSFALNRVVATALHVGMSVLVAWKAPLVLATITIHAGLNLTDLLRRRRERLRPRPA